MGILKGRKEEGKKEKWTNLFRDLFLLIPRECSKLVKLGADEKGYCGLYNVRERGERRGINRVFFLFKKNSPGNENFARPC